MSRDGDPKARGLILEAARVLIEEKGCATVSDILDMIQDDLARLHRDKNPRNVISQTLRHDPGLVGNANDGYRLKNEGEKKESKVQKGVQERVIVNPLERLLFGECRPKTVALPDRLKGRSPKEIECVVVWQTPYLELACRGNGQSVFRPELYGSVRIAVGGSVNGRPEDVPSEAKYFVPGDTLRIWVPDPKNENQALEYIIQVAENHTIWVWLDMN